MVLEIENAPSRPRWVRLPPPVSIVSVDWNFGAKWRARARARLIPATLADRVAFLMLAFSRLFLSKEPPLWQYRRYHVERLSRDGLTELHVPRIFTFYVLFFFLIHLTALSRAIGAERYILRNFEDPKTRFSYRVSDRNIRDEESRYVKRVGFQGSVTRAVYSSASARARAIHDIEFIFMLAAIERLIRVVPSIRALVLVRWMIGADSRNSS